MCLFWLLQSSISSRFIIHRRKLAILRPIDMTLTSVTAAFIEEQCNRNRGRASYQRSRFRHIPLPKKRSVSSCLHLTMSLRAPLSLPPAQRTCRVERDPPNSASRLCTDKCSVGRRWSEPVLFNIQRVVCALAYKKRRSCELWSFIRGGESITHCKKRRTPSGGGVRADHLYKSGCASSDYGGVATYTPSPSHEVAGPFFKCASCLMLAVVVLQHRR